ncbi:MAG TPA: hypothetical protein VFT87_01135 [Candidatus Saccharimonadales bacterium]|nr:hypothetical protein [Candidatus Saccharimonadales bacterium]
MNNIKDQLRHLTGGWLTDEELEDLAGFVERLKADARREGYLTLASLSGVRKEAELVMEKTATTLTASLREDTKVENYVQERLAHLNAKEKDV